MRFDAHGDVADALPDWQGKTIVDVTNAYGVPSERLGGRSSVEAVAKAFTGGRLVKGFNHLGASVLAQDPAMHGGRSVVFLASDDHAAAIRGVHDVALKSPFQCSLQNEHAGSERIPSIDVRAAISANRFHSSSSRT